MPIDEQKIDETVLAILYLTLHDDGRAWKSFDSDSMNRLYEKDFISDPEWKKVQSASEQDGKIVAKVERQYMTLTDYSPVAK